MTNYPNPDSNSAQLFQRACKVLPGGNSRSTIFYSPYPIFARSGQGCRITDVDGVERVDFVNNYTVLIHGHAHPEISKAVAAQLELGAGFAHPTEAELLLAELLTSRVPSFERIRFVNSGSEAVMNAIKAARAYTERPLIAKCEGVYHGSYDYVEVSLDSSAANWGEDTPLSVPYARGTPPKVLEDVAVIPFNDVERSERILTAHAGELAAVVIDVMPNRAGLIPATPEYLTMLREVTRRHGIVLILDEVISLRLGYQGGQTEFGIQPDLTTMGKVIGGGLPVGAVAGKAEVMEMFNHSRGKAPLPHAGTFNGNPLTMAAGHAAMQLMTEEAFARLNALGERARSQLHEAIKVAGLEGRITGKGSLFMIHLKDKPLTTYRDSFKSPEEQQLLASVHRHFLNNGIIIAAGGLGALSTPMTEVEIDQLSEVFLGALRALPQPAAVPA
ncbi:MAG: aspartate aminotransferase family protein [SAR324 cluster bacterium]|nr:aspartate aminotransferase family protein [SAR324 cluster bacterium]